MHSGNVGLSEGVNSEVVNRKWNIEHSPHSPFHHSLFHHSPPKMLHHKSLQASKYATIKRRQGGMTARQCIDRVPGKALGAMRCGDRGQDQARARPKRTRSPHDFKF
jgi:hypothetical protein